MRRANIGWYGAGIAAILGLCTQEACGSKGTGGGGGSSSSSGMGGTTGSETTTKSTSTSGMGGATTSTSGTGGASTSSTTSSTSTGGPMPGDSVLTHHKNPNRDGLYVQPLLTKAAVGTLHADTSFAPTGINGNVYAQPLFVDGGTGGKDLVIVATEANEVHALDAADGSKVWTANLGTPVPLSSLPCGNIDPFGVTGTPVIDLATRTLFVDAEVTPDGGTTKQHLIFALSIDTGAIQTGWPVDVAAKAQSGSLTFTPSYQGQRGALALLGGKLYVPFGGRFGDCGNYHGWVVAVSTSDPTQVQAWATTSKGGGTWMPNGISSDGTDLFIATGNTFATNTWGGGNAVIRLSGASLAMSAYFAPKNWLNLDNSDLDLGTGPVVFDLPGSTPSALAISFGKDGYAYLLDRSNLGGVTDALATLHVASNHIISAPVLYSTATATYVAAKGAGAACTGGTSGNLFAIKVVPGSPPTLAASWCATSGNGSPIVTTSDGHADAIVWSLGAESDSRLHAVDGDTGAAISFTDSGKAFQGMRRYNTPIAAKGRIFVPVDGSHGGAVAFKL